jgi:HD superfamily phosphohydrolase
MKLQNPILITLNNTLHIKADNLEPVEVDSSCKSQLLTLAFNVGKHTINTFYVLKEGQGINISELSDRIEVREIKVNAYNKSSTAFIKRAFLLPVKEDITDSLKERKDIEDAYRKQFGIAKSYTIEEIEKAIDSLGKNWKMPKIKEAIINNLKK